MTEKRLLKQRGAKQHPMSGAGRIKLDGSDEDDLIEVKDAPKGYRITAKELHDAHVEAAKQGKSALWLIRFVSLPGWVAEVRLVPEER